MEFAESVAGKGFKRCGPSSKRGLNGYGHDLKQWIRPDRELPEEGSIISADEQEATGGASRKHAHGDNRGARVIAVRKGYGDQNAVRPTDRTNPSFSAEPAAEICEARRTTPSRIAPVC
jgi:hypothetical protein